ncbi:hypothetical protein [Lichenifustis flavocetrariae]|uniref:Uncharacterized protein n=1 Tax=Lichenifustis flavocetrariae TaxID=2949735 RepID=A0AA42CRF0_9HYPH|nr:hypothetical protein [Lichenifustis flavocetrariae]MCW6512422.1 hypothetical protein [Lichenifustis flavocetrariae]
MNIDDRELWGPLLEQKQSSGQGVRWTQNLVSGFNEGFAQLQADEGFILDEKD